MSIFKKSLEEHWTPWTEGLRCTSCDWAAKEGGLVCPDCGEATQRATVRFQYRGEIETYTAYLWAYGVPLRWEAKPAILPPDKENRAFVCSHCGAPNS